jgi:hypothetical protein
VSDGVQSRGSGFVGRRIHAENGEAWQMPQGASTTARTRGAAQEPAEETASSVRVLAECRLDQLRFAARGGGDRAEGEISRADAKWFALRFRADGRSTSGRARIDAWRWFRRRVVDLIVPFKRDVYKG